MDFVNERDDSIDPAAVSRYFDAVGGAAATAGYMAHARKLPADAAAYRKQCELRILRDWLDAVPPGACVLDVGCGSGNWAEVFAARYARVIGIDRSPAMVEAARLRLAPMQNVSIITGDVLSDLPKESFDLIFVGGVCMYLNDGDVETLLRSLAARLRDGGTIILRESTVRRGRRVARGEYQAVYRSVGDYRRLIGTRPGEIRRNRGYERFEIAADLADLVPGRTGAIVWRVVRAIAPLTFILLPRMMDALRVEWPRLQNHFFRVR